MWSYCQRPRRTIAEVLFDFTPVDIPFDYILDLFPPLNPRSFSIASSLKVKSKKGEGKGMKMIYLANRLHFYIC